MPATGDPITAVSFTNPIGAGQTVTVSFKAKVNTIPNPNPSLSSATTTFSYTVNLQDPNGANGDSVSNIVKIPVFRNNLRQRINELIKSVALEQVALAAIANAESAKIQ